AGRAARRGGAGRRRRTPGRTGDERPCERAARVHDRAGMGGAGARGRRGADLDPRRCGRPTRDRDVDALLRRGGREAALVTGLAFLSPASRTFVSPLARAPGEGVTDASHVGKLELRGALDGIEPGPGEDLLRYAPSRALLVTEGPVLQLSRAGVRTYDMTAALAAFEFEGEDALRRLTDLEPSRLPAAGAIARDTWALIEQRCGGGVPVFGARGVGPDMCGVGVGTLRRVGRWQA